MIVHASWDYPKGILRSSYDYRTVSLKSQDLLAIVVYESSGRRTIINKYVQFINIFLGT